MDSKFLISNLAAATALTAVLASPPVLSIEPATATNPTNIQPQDANTRTDAANDIEDAKVTQQIRDALRSDESLSPQAKAVSVASNPDAVILRGAVLSTAEKERIEELAGQYSGDRQVNSELTLQDDSVGDGHHLGVVRAAH